MAGPRPGHPTCWLDKLDGRLKAAHGESGMVVLNPLQRPRSPALRRMSYPGVLKIQLPFNPAPRIVADFAPVIEVRDTGALGVDELQLQGRGGIADFTNAQIAAGGNKIG